MTKSIDSTAAAKSDLDLQAIWDALAAAGAQAWVERVDEPWTVVDACPMVKIGPDVMLVQWSHGHLYTAPASDFGADLETVEEFVGRREAYYARPDVAARRAKLIAETDEAILDADSSDV